MLQQWLNAKTVLFIVAVSIVTGTVFYSGYLSKKIAADEKERVEIWAEAQTTILNSSDQASFNLAAKISAENKDIPIIETDENDKINPNNSVNLDTAKMKSDSNYLVQKLNEFKKEHDPIVLVLSEKPYSANKYYYGKSILQQEITYYPIVQLFIVGLFILITIIAMRASYISTQNQVWAGMAKETAHQLGTPVTSLKGWVEVLKDIPGNEKIISEIEKDVNRLELVTDRFGKIGSHPQLEEHNITAQIKNMVGYMKKRAGGNIDFVIQTQNEDEITALVSPPLFDWVIENLLKNSLDAMEGHGKITVSIQKTVSKIFIDIADTGKGISKANLPNIFKPGFSTKKRGWGLGLTLAKRIIEQYHKGSIYVKSSEPGKGTTFRIELGV